VAGDAEIVSISEGKSGSSVAVADFSSGLPAPFTSAPTTDIVFGKVTLDSKER